MKRFRVMCLKPKRLGTPPQTFEVEAESEINAIDEVGRMLGKAQGLCLSDYAEVKVKKLH